MNRYSRIIEKIFLDRYQVGSREVPFLRHDIEETAVSLGIKAPRNYGDLIYSFRYRNDLPAAVRDTAPESMEWVIEGTGDARYRFCLVTRSRVVPNPMLLARKIPDATPEIIESYALSDEQALLAKVRYNRLIDIFLGITCYSLQNHLRTKVRDVGQIEIDEVYVGVDRYARQYVIPVQAKGGNDQLSVVQTRQDLACCEERFPQLICRAVSAQFISDEKIALFELTLDDDQIRVVNEAHYTLAIGRDISEGELKGYRDK
jgi:hypothetical protein